MICLMFIYVLTLTILEAKQFQQTRVTFSLILIKLRLFGTCRYSGAKVKSYIRDNSTQYGTLTDSSVVV